MCDTYKIYENERFHICHNIWSYMAHICNIHVDVYGEIYDIYMLLVCEDICVLYVT